MTPEEVRRIVREELGKTTPDTLSFGDRVRIIDTYRADIYPGEGIVTSPFPDSDGEYRIAFSNGEWTYAQPSELSRA